MKKHTLLLACAMRILLNLIALPNGEGNETRIPLFSHCQNKYTHMWKKNNDGQNLPRVGKVASKASRIGFQRDENVREQLFQVSDLREYPIAAYLTFPFIPSRRRLPLRGRSILRLRRAPSSRGCSAVMPKRDIREYCFPASPHYTSPHGEDGKHSEPDRVLWKLERMT